MRRPTPDAWDADKRPCLRAPMLELASPHPAPGLKPRSIRASQMGPNIRLISCPIPEIREARLSVEMLLSRCDHRVGTAP